MGATIYFGSEQSRRQIEEISAFERAHELGSVTVLWAYLRNSAFKKDGVDYHVSADLTGQANHWRPPSAPISLSKDGGE